jgi:hypothetical protein
LKKEEKKRKKEKEEDEVPSTGARALMSLETTVRECEAILPRVFGRGSDKGKDTADWETSVDRARVLSMLGDACVSMQVEGDQERTTEFEMPARLWSFLSQQHDGAAAAATAAGRGGGENNSLPEYGGDLTETTRLPGLPSKLKQTALETIGSTTWWLRVGVFCYVTAIFTVRRQKSMSEEGKLQQQRDLHDLYRKLASSKNEQGKQALKRCNTNSALDYFSSALNLFQQMSDVINVGWIKLNIVQCLRVMVQSGGGGGGHGQQQQQQQNITLTTEISSLYATSLELCNEILTLTKGEERMERTNKNKCSTTDTDTSNMLVLMRSAEEVLARVSLDYAIALRFAVKESSGACTKETFHLVQRHFQKSVELGRNSRLLCGRAHFHQGLFVFENMAPNPSNQQRNAVCELSKRLLMKSLSLVEAEEEEEEEERDAEAIELSIQIQEALKMVGAKKN